MPWPDRGWRRRDPDRDLPRHAADQGCRERRQDRARRGGPRHAYFRASHGRDHRHLAGRTGHRDRRDRGERARRAATGPELRHGAAGDGRARPLALGQLARLAVRAAQRRVTRTGRRPHALPARAGRDGELDGALRRRGRDQPHRRLLRHQRRAYFCAGRDAASSRRRDSAAPAGAPLGGVDAVGFEPLPASAVAPGEQLFFNRRALQRQRLEEMARVAGAWRLGRLRRRRPRANRGRLQQPRRLHRLRRPRRGGRDGRSHPPLHVERELAPRDRQHRNQRHRERAKAARRQADHQLDQFRGWRAGRHRPARPGKKIRRGGDRADHRRARDGQDRRRQSSRSRRASSSSRATATSCRNRTS